MKGCYHILIYYTRVICTFLAPAFLFVAGMAFISPQSVEIGGVTLNAGPMETFLIGMVLYAFAAAKAIRRF